MSTRTHVSVRSTVAPLIALLLVAAVVVLAPPRADAATPTSTVAGKVTLGGKAVSGATITVYATEDTGRDKYAQVKTRADGTFTAPFKTTKFELTQYRYWYEVTDPSHRVVSKLTSFRPTLGKTVTKNTAVHSAGEITGYAKLPKGTDFSRLRIQVQGPTDGQANLGNDDEVRLVYPTTLKPRPSGFYRAWGLPPGKYQLVITDPTLGYQPECHDGTFPGEQLQFHEYTCSVTPITIDYGQKKKAASQTLNLRSALIKGQVLDNDNKPVDDNDDLTWVEAVASDGTVISDTDQPHAKGVFRFRGLKPGSYTIRTNLASRYENSYYGGDGTAADAEPVEVGPGEKATGIIIGVRDASRTYTTVKAVTGGAKFTVAVRRVFDKKAVVGPVVVVLGDKRKTIDLNSKGRGTITLTGVPKGKTSWKVAFLGTVEVGTSRALGSVTVP